MCSEVLHRSDCRLISTINRSGWSQVACTTNELLVELAVGRLWSDWFCVSAAAGRRRLSVSEQFYIGVYEPPFCSAEL